MEADVETAGTKAARRVLSIPEILSSVLSFNSSKDAARCQVVCRAWFPVAIPITWAHVGSFKQIFSALLPLSPVGEEEGKKILVIVYFQLFPPLKGHSVLTSRKGFTRNITFCDWKRAVARFSHMKSLHLNSDELFSEYSIFELLVSRPNRSIFPKLEHLDIVLDYPYLLLRLATIFLHVGVKRLQVHSSISTTNPETHQPTPRFEAAASFVHEASHYCFLIEHLDFKATHPADVDNLEVLAVSRVHLPAFRKLRVFFAPCELLTTLTVFFFLGSLLELEEVHSHDNNIEAGDVFYRPLHLHLPAHPVQPLSFAKLTHLELCDYIENLHWFFLRVSPGMSLPKLETLKMTMHWRDDAAVMKAILKKLTTGSPRLKKLWIIRRCFTDHEVPKEDDTHFPMDYNFLQVLTNFAELEDISLAHAWPVQIDNDELANLVSNLPSLLALDLNSSPLFSTRTSITLDALEMISQHCSRLIDLGLYLQLDENLDTRINADAGVLFPDLKKISFGRSFLSETNESRIVQYLAKVLRPTCGLDVRMDVSCSM